jgi:uracil-DNA glycosylase
MIDCRAFIGVIDEISHRLLGLADAGIKGFDCSPVSLRILDEWGQGGVGPRAVETLEEIRADIGDCQRCKLCHGRTRIVFGAGNPKARLMFIGEGPGYEEDQAGEPFVGPAGQLLTRIIEAIRLTRDQVYIANVVKCRPPGNRLPEPDEIATCSPFLHRQIAAIQPHYICTLGSCAAQTLLNSKVPISRLRGRFWDYQKIRVLPTFHPAYLLRNPEKKREVWEDMKLLMQEFTYEG